MADDWKIKRVAFTRHALNQIFTRSIGIDDVKAVISSHEILAEYPDDFPYPSRLLLGFVKGRPLHVVLGYNSKESAAYVVTVYEPNPVLWEPGFRRRRKT
ncbi:MAG: DUF4258 domain-containing protein [Nitrospinae bacterium]|nr:DUF4258 domain-containing protein [Nitrospinota bacterium]